MIYIKAGAFEIGSTDFNDTLPLHKVNSFWMDEHEVTNAQFEEFAKATHYITIAERPLNPKDFLDVSKTKLVIGSAVFSPPKGKVSLDDPLQWWKHIEVQTGNIQMGPTAISLDTIMSQ